ncbi:olfactory receptor 480-like [Vombatus ursinus]|uniref:olfactory receptor 480-like n=1 Tax=Vombatus ursinus TaxID=29139 RepID=UPI000FFD7686|nr:olfactory receptor 480-like [Vombatus ursinus]XP_027705486.1 olfactory receptor 480-like [Vombatus ursinus]
MSGNNCTAVTEFIILGLTDDTALCVILFLIFLGVYTVTLISNLSIITLIRNSSQLHTPMYLFLSHLAFVDIGYSSSVTPVMLKNFLVDKTTLPLGGCVAQLFFGVSFGTTEFFLLAVMAYDRYVAICNPLLYSTNMSSRVCTLFLITSYLGGCVNAWIFTGCLLNRSFCGPSKINHFFCDYSPLLKLSYSEDDVAEILPSASAGSIIMITVSIIIISYVYILFSVLKIRSTEGRSKAFSTCTSHLTAVTLFYGTITFIYVMPKSSYSTDVNKVVSVFYIVMIPMLNPLIYSLRNNEVKGALQKMLSRKYPFFMNSTQHNK